MANFKAFYNEAKYILRIESLMIMLDVMLMALMRHVIFIFQK
ncbi:Uncharacterised protein [Campylobacter coli]|nr:Uncharacterised protein [Campylobacter coli]